jgi:hypothetical protein
MTVPIRDTTVLRQRMIENIRMRKLSPKTQGALIPAYADWPHTSAALPILRKKKTEDTKLHGPNLVIRWSRMAPGEVSPGLSVARSICR